MWIEVRGSYEWVVIKSSTEDYHVHWLCPFQTATQYLDSCDYFTYTK
jgi:hypothetical protein